MKSMLIKLLTRLCEMILLGMLLIILKLQLILPISFLFIIFDVILSLLIIVPLFIPDRFEHLKIFQINTYNRMRKSTLAVLSAIVIICYWPIVKLILLGLLRSE